MTSCYLQRALCKMAGRTPLHYCVANQNPCARSVGKLCCPQAAETVDKQGLLPLHRLVINSGNHSVLQILLHAFPAAAASFCAGSKCGENGAGTSGGGGSGEGGGCKGAGAVGGAWVGSLPLHLLCQGICCVLCRVRYFMCGVSCAVCVV